MDAQLARAVDDEVERSRATGHVAFVVLWPGEEQGVGWATDSLNMELLLRHDRVSAAGVLGSLVLRLLDEVAHARGHSRGAGFNDGGEH